MSECGECEIKLKHKDVTISCSGKCSQSFHSKCVDLSVGDIQLLQKCKGMRWFCNTCITDFQNVFMSINQEINSLKENFNKEVAEIKRIITNKCADIDHNKKDNDVRSFAQTVAGEVVVIKPKNNELSSSKRTLEAVQKHVNPLALEVGIKEIWNTREGGVAIKCDTRNEIEKVKTAVEKKLSKTYNVVAPNLKNPCIKVIDIVNELTADNLLSHLKKQNSFLNLDTTELTVKVIKRMRTKYMSIIECDPGSHRRILEEGYLYLDWSRCRVFNYVSVFRCFKCGGFGHRRDECKSAIKCLKCCALDHSTENCVCDSYSCNNCIEANKNINTQFDISHSMYDNACPVFRKKVELQRSKIKYSEQ